MADSRTDRAQGNIQSTGDIGVVVLGARGGYSGNDGYAQLPLTADGSALVVDTGGGGGTIDTNVTEVDSNPVDTGAGAAGAGTQRVALADSNFTGNALDVNIASGVTLEVNLDEANDSVQVYGYDGADNQPIRTNTSGHTVISVDSGVLDGSTTIAATGVAEQVIVASTPCRSLSVQAHPDNADILTVGNSVSQSIALYPGDSISYNIDDVNKIYVKGTINDVVNFGGTAL